MLTAGLAKIFAATSMPVSWGAAVMVPPGVGVQHGCASTLTRPRAFTPSAMSLINSSLAKCERPFEVRLGSLHGVGAQATH